MVLHIAAQACQWQNRQMEPRPKGAVGRFRPKRWKHGPRIRSSRMRDASPRLLERGAFLVVGLLLGAIGTAHAVSESPFPPFVALSRAFVLVQNEYVRGVDEEKVVEGAIRGMIGSLDPHSTYFTPEEYRLFRTDLEGHFEGIGVQIGVRDGWLTVLSVFEGGPAARAGLLPGDRFLHIDGLVARDMRIEEAVRKVRGEPGSAVKVGIRREGEEHDLELEIERGRVHIEAVKSRELEDGIVHVSIVAFQENAARDVERALAAVEAKGALRGLLLDVRNNGGGLVSEAVAIADRFLRRGTIVTTRGRDGRVLHRARAHIPKTRGSLPIVVLINGRSASAAEILAAALKENARALVVGTRTFGKGSVQRLFEQSDGSAIKLTTALHHGPNGETIQARGVEPDVLVEAVDPVTFASAVLSEPSGGEALLDRHIEAVRRDPEETMVFGDDLQARVAYQLLKAELR
jgi:carboxyl-terminal processing protease